MLPSSLYWVVTRLCFFGTLYTYKMCNYSCSLFYYPLSYVLPVAVFCSCVKQGMLNSKETESRWKKFMWHEAKVVTRSCYFGHRGIKWSTNSEVTWSCGCWISAKNTEITKIKIGNSSPKSKGLALWRNQANSKNKWSQVEWVKGTVAWDFPPLAFLISWSHLGSCCIYYIFFQFWFKFAELFKFEMRSALWATAGNQNCFADTRDLKLECHMPRLFLFMYIHFLSSQSL
jgi:hypothetical protein